MTSLLYQDIVDYLEQQHPDTVIYALIAKIVIVYGALIFVLLQFRPEREDGSVVKSHMPAESEIPQSNSGNTPADRLSQLEDVTAKTTLRSRYHRVIDGDDK